MYMKVLEKMTNGKKKNRENPKFKFLVKNLM